MKNHSRVVAPLISTGVVLAMSGILYFYICQRKSGPKALDRDRLPYLSSENSSYLSEGEVERFEEAALAGDRRAAEEVSRFYRYYKKDPEKTRYWTRLAESMGSKR